MRKFVIDAIVTGLPAKTDYTLGEYKLQLPFKPLIFSGCIVSVRSSKPTFDRSCCHEFLKRTGDAWTIHQEVSIQKGLGKEHWYGWPLKVEFSTGGQLRLISLWYVEILDLSHKGFARVSSQTDHPIILWHNSVCSTVDVTCVLVGSPGCRLDTVSNPQHPCMA